MADELFFPPLLNNLEEFQPSNMIFDKALSKKCEIIENRKKMQKNPNLSKILFFTLFSCHSFLTWNQ